MKLQLLALLAILLATAACTHAQPQVTTEPHMNLVHAKGNIWVVEDYYYDRENSAFYIGEEEVTVISAGWTPETAELMVKKIREVTDKPVARVIDTNYHPDRAGGNLYFKKIGAKVVGTQMTKDLMIKDWDHMIQLVQKGHPDYRTLPMSLPEVVKEDAQFENGKIKLLYLGQSHTPDDIFVYFPEEKTLYGGCIINEKIGWLGSANLKEYPNTIRKLKSYDIETIISGHWSSMHGPELIDKYLAMLKGVVGKK